MATLASLTALGGVVGDDFTDANGRRRVIGVVHADGVYTWKDEASGDTPVTNNAVSAVNGRRLHVSIGNTGIQILSHQIMAAENTNYAFDVPFASAAAYTSLVGQSEMTGGWGDGLIGMGFLAFRTDGTQFAVDYDSELLTQVGIGNGAWDSVSIGGLV